MDPLADFHLYMLISNSSWTVLCQNTLVTYATSLIIRGHLRFEKKKTGRLCLEMIKTITQIWDKFDQDI